MVAEADIRAIIRLLGQVAALPGGITEKKICFLDGLCHFTGAAEWRWALFSVVPEGLSCSASARRRIGNKESSDLALGEAITGLTESNSLAPEMSKTIVSRRSLDPCTESRIALCREPHENEFSSREIQLATLVLDTIPWLHWRDWKPLPAAHKLAPRHQLTLDLLLLGLGRKEIASRIGISPGTVVGYIRELYQRFGVNSQAELMRIGLQDNKRP